jgi:hypothetical protein
MSNYTKATNFATKDTLPTGNAGKIVKGTEIDDEFNAIASAISSKADTASPTFTGTPAAPTAASGTNTTQLATTAFVKAEITSSVTDVLEAVYPVGSIYINASVTTNPNTLLGFGTWEAFGAGRVLVGQNASDSLFDTLEETGGSKDAIVVSHTHTASTDTAGAHTHTMDRHTEVSNTAKGTVGDNGTFASTRFTAGMSTEGAHSHTITVASSGSSGTNANIQPYITVKMWKRTA